jgi:hypothetical protein
MAISIDVNGVAISYPQAGDVGWAADATQFAVQSSAALAKIGLSTGTDVVVQNTLEVLGDAILQSDLDVVGKLDVDNVEIVNGLIVDTDVLIVDSVNNRVGINNAIPSVDLDVIGDVSVSGTLATGTLATTDITIDTDLIKTDSTNNRVGINIAIPTEALDVVGKIKASSDIITAGLLIADDSTSATVPTITFDGDTNTGIGRSSADTIDLITNGESRFRIESTGQIKAVYESTVGTDYNTTLHNGYLCRAWVNFDGTLSTPIAPRASGNVSSVTKTGAGSYTVNFTEAMPDANYAVFYSARIEGSVAIANEVNPSAPAKSTTSIRVMCVNLSAVFTDAAQFTLGVFR